MPRTRSGKAAGSMSRRRTDITISPRTGPRLRTGSLHPLDTLDSGSACRPPHRRLVSTEATNTEVTNTEATAARTMDKDTVTTTGGHRRRREGITAGSSIAHRQVRTDRTIGHMGEIGEVTAVLEDIDRSGLVGSLERVCCSLEYHMMVRLGASRREPVNGIPLYYALYDRS